MVDKLSEISIASYAKDGEHTNYVQSNEIWSSRFAPLYRQTARIQARLRMCSLVWIRVFGYEKMSAF